MLLYYITDRTQLPGGEASRRHSLLAKIAEAARAGVDFIQLREKDLSARELEELAAESLSAVRQNSATTRLLINSRTDIALASSLDGVHLTSADLNPADVRSIQASALRHGPAQPNRFLVAVSCHSAPEVRLAISHGADFVVLAPIFEKVQAAQSGLGLEPLRAVTRRLAPELRVEAGDNQFSVSVLALGGVTVENAAACISAGAAGIAGIRIFQQGNMADTVSRLRSIR